MESLSVDEVRELDQRAIREFGVPGLVLMENAGRGATDILCRQGIAGQVVICCGLGNNGGDGLVMARHLDLRGFDVRVVHLEGDWKGDPAVQHKTVQQSGIPIAVAVPDNVGDLLAGADWIVDALLGTGAKGDPRPPLDAMIDAMNRSTARRFAVDVPSGLDADSGRPGRPTFRADHTCTFVAPKTGLLAPPARAWVGTLHTTDIGAPRSLIESYGIRPAFDS